MDILATTAVVAHHHPWLLASPHRGGEAQARCGQYETRARGQRWLPAMLILARIEELPAVPRVLGSRLLRLLGRTDWGFGAKQAT